MIIMITTDPSKLIFSVFAADIWFGSFACIWDAQSGVWLYYWQATSVFLNFHWLVWWAIERMYCSANQDSAFEILEWFKLKIFKWYSLCPEMQIDFYPGWNNPENLREVVRGGGFWGLDRVGWDGTGRGRGWGWRDSREGMIGCLGLPLWNISPCVEVFKFIYNWWQWLQNMLLFSLVSHAWHCRYNVQQAFHGRALQTTRHLLKEGHAHCVRPTRSCIHHEAELCQHGQGGRCCFQGSSELHFISFIEFVTISQDNEVNG